MRLIAVSLLLSGCITVPEPAQQGGSEPTYRHVYENDPQHGSGECTLTYANIREFGKGADVEVGAVRPCSLTFKADEITQGDASLTGEVIRLNAAQLEQLLALAALGIGR